VLKGGQAWSRRMRRRQVLRITDDAGTACVSALFYNADEPLERYNMADTLKAQFTAFLTADRVLYSDMGRVLASITRDTCGWHDTISGCGDAASNQARFGAGTYQELRNGFHRNARDNFLVELGKYGLGKRDVVANVNFFTKVAVGQDGEDGALRWVANNSKPGAYVELRFEMDTLVVLTNTPHPLDPSAKYGPPAVTLSLSEGTGPGPDDPCRIFRPENERGFALTEAYVAERRGAL
jgi:urea carboxylase-associated protein 2